MKNKLEGFITYPYSAQLSEINLEKEYDIEEHQLLKNGNIFKNQNEDFNRIHFDLMPTDEYWGGYLKGFLYTDRKFNGTFYYTRDSGENKESLSGVYKILKNGLAIKGDVYEENNSGHYHFYIRLKEKNG